MSIGREWRGDESAVHFTRQEFVGEVEAVRFQEFVNHRFGVGRGCRAIDGRDITRVIKIVLEVLIRADVQPSVAVHDKKVLCAGGFAWALVHRAVQPKLRRQRAGAFQRGALFGLVVVDAGVGGRAGQGRVEG